MPLPWSRKRMEYEDQVALLAGSVDSTAALQVRNAINLATAVSPRIAVIGQAGVGKSTTVEKLFGLPKGSLPVSNLERGNDKPIEVDVSTPRGHVTIIDMPGLGETLEVDNMMLPYYGSVLPTADVALWILDEGRNRAPDELYVNRLRSMLDLEVLSRIVFGINKVDLMKPGNWVNHGTWPDSTLRASIEKRRSSIIELFHSDPSRVVAYSAEKEYNLDELKEAMLDAIPPDKILALDKRADPRDGFDRGSRRKAGRLLGKVGL